MKHFILGTAGHVDHGKTALVRALTGVDTDTLPEEKRRGLTIENGFAPLPLADGLTVSMVDVPGHEALIGHMLAGASGMDGVLFVIAADEGVMPQTREHLDILTLLGITRGVVALTKIDRVSRETLAQRQETVCRFLKGAGLEQAPLCPVSAVTGEGLDALRTALLELVGSSSARRDDLPFRLAVDRVFSVDGQGTVVTGTVARGSTTAGETLWLYPREQPVRVRGLEHHGLPQQRLWAGMRGGVNLSGVEKKEIKRGDTLAAPHALTVTEEVEVQLTLLPHAPYPVRHNSRLHFHSGAGKQVCQVLLPGRKHLEPGETGFARLRFAQPAALAAGDRFVVRFFSPVVTMGGGTVLTLQPPSGHKMTPDHLRTLEVLARGSEEARVLAALEQGKTRLLKADQLAREAGLTTERCTAVLEMLSRRGQAVQLAGRWLSAGQYQMLWQKTKEILSDYHRREPLWPGMDRQTLRAQVLSHGSGRIWSALLTLFAREYGLSLSGEWVALPGFTVTWTPEYDALRRLLRERYDRAGLTPPDQDEVLDAFGRQREKAVQVFRRMALDGELVSIAPGLWVRPHCLARGARLLKGRFARQAVCTLGELRDALGLSRRETLVILEYWDRIGLTRRVGEGRMLSD